MAFGGEEGGGFRGHRFLDSNECPGHTSQKPTREARSARKCPLSLPHPALWDPRAQPCLAQSSALGSLQGELDPVAESSEEAEAASGSSELGPVPSQESCRPELLGPEVEASGQGVGSR